MNLAEDVFFPDGQDYYSIDSILTEQSVGSVRYFGTISLSIFILEAFTALNGSWNANNFNLYFWGAFGVNGVVGKAFLSGAQLRSLCQPTLCLIILV